MTRVMYQRTEKFLKRLRTKIRREYNHLAVFSFDELNPARTREQTKELQERLLAFNEKEYVEIAKEGRKYAEGLLLPAEKEKLKKKKFDPLLLALGVLSAYNIITGYLYLKEAERKRLRLYEEMLTMRHFLDRGGYNKALKRSADLWYTQSMQYAISVEDTAVMETYKDAGIKKVVWVSETDDRVCKTCRERNGTVYNIDNVPEKPHYNCRCSLVPYRPIKKP